MTRLAEHWCPLLPGSVFDYLVCTGTIESASGLRVTRAAGRNAVMLVDDVTNSQARFAVKQFGPRDRDWGRFDHEIAVVEHLATLPVAQPVFVDADWRVIVFPAKGSSQWEFLTCGKALSADHGDELRRLLVRLHQYPSPCGQSSLPPVVAWLTGRATVDITSLGQQRFIGALQREPWAVEAANAYAEAWTSGTGPLVHGDLKLEHILVSGAGPLELIDWEVAGEGLPEWDYASVVQSVLVGAVLGFTDGMSSPTEFCRVVVRDLDLTSESFRRAVALRLIQSGCELDAARTQISSQAGSLAQLAANIIRSPNAMTSLLELPR